MNTSELVTFFKRADAVHGSDKAVILATLECDNNINIATFGGPMEMGELRSQLIKILQSSIQNTK